MEVGSDGVNKKKQAQTKSEKEDEVGEDVVASLFIKIFLSTSQNGHRLSVFGWSGERYYESARGEVPALCLKRCEAFGLPFHPTSDVFFDAFPGDVRRANKPISPHHHATSTS